MKKSFSWGCNTGGRGRHEVLLPSSFWGLRFIILFNNINMNRNWSFLIFGWSFAHYAFLRNLQWTCCSIPLKNLKFCIFAFFELCGAFLYCGSLWNDTYHVVKLKFVLIDSYNVCWDHNCCEKEMPHDEVLWSLCEVILVLIFDLLKWYDLCWFDIVAWLGCYLVSIPSFKRILVSFGEECS